MKKILLLAFLLPLFAIAQSKKKIYQQLKIESEIQARKNDSLEKEIFVEKQIIVASNFILKSQNEGINKERKNAISKQNEFLKIIDDYNLLIKTFHPKGFDEFVLVQQQQIEYSQVNFKESEIPKVPVKPVLENLDFVKKVKEKNALIQEYISISEVFVQDETTFLNQLRILQNQNREIEKNISMEIKSYIDKGNIYRIQTYTAHDEIIKAIQAVKSAKFSSELVPEGLKSYFEESEIINNETPLPTKTNDYGNSFSDGDMTTSDYAIEALALPPSTNVEEEILDMVEEFAEFPGGPGALKTYLAQNIVYPQTALDMNIQGTIYVKFVVSKLGTISNVKVMKGIEDCPECSTEAIRVFRAMPKWKPARNNNKDVNSYFNSKVKFVIPEPEPEKK